MVPDALSRNDGADVSQPLDDLDDKIYKVFMDNDIFVTQLRQEQSQDAVISGAIKKVAEGVKIEEGRFRHVRTQLRVEDGILVKSGRTVIPASLRKFVLQEFPTTGHIRNEKLYSRIQRRFYWPNLFRFILNHITQCEACQKCKPTSHRPKSPLLPVHEAEKPMEFITIDIGYMIKDTEGYRYILLIDDLFSKYIHAVPLKEQGAEDICNALYHHWVLVHGLPNFGNVIREICNKFSVVKRRASGYHSQGNGFAERSIRNVKEMFRYHLHANNIPQTERNVTMSFTRE